ncbi:MAG: hypothetical protein NWQ46_07210, partial [Spirosomaceae bacterium]|nr:hypothetical protein [Spirosomataceae bacterium]
MKLSIENIAQFFICTLIALSSYYTSAYAQSDFFVSSKSCILDQGSQQQGGNQQGGGMTPTGGCDAPTTFFDTDTS